MEEKLISNEKFEEIVAQNKRRTYYQLQRLNLRDPHQEYFQEGLCALWSAYIKYEPDKGPMATYFNYAIRHHLLTHIRKIHLEQNDQDRGNKVIQQLYEQQLKRGRLFPESTTDKPLSDLYC